MKLWQVGDKVTRRRTVGHQEIALFSSLVGDLNPIHSDPLVAREAGFAGPIAHGMVAGSLFSEILGNELPGPGSVYLQQFFKFLAPVYMPSEIDLCVEVIAVREDQKIITVRTTCANSAGDLCVDGEAVLLRRQVQPSCEAGNEH